MNKTPDPIKEHEEVARHSDSKIDQDFIGFPHGNAAENIINPSSSEEKKVAAVNVTDGEKVNRQAEKDEQESDGSGGAFSATENMRDDD